MQKLQTRKCFCQEYVDNTILLYISDFKNTNSSDGCSHGFWDAGLVVAGRYGDTIGGVFYLNMKTLTGALRQAENFGDIPKNMQIFQCRNQ